MRPVRAWLWGRGSPEKGWSWRQRSWTPVDEVGLGEPVGGVVGVVAVDPVAELAAPAPSFVAVEQPAAATQAE